MLYGSTISATNIVQVRKIFIYPRRVQQSEDRADLFKGMITAQQWSTQERRQHPRNATCGRVHIGHSLITLITQRYIRSICSLRANTMYGSTSQSPRPVTLLPRCATQVQLLCSSVSKRCFCREQRAFLKGGGKIGSILAEMLL